MQIPFGPAVLIFIGALISASGAIWASQQQAKFERELRQKNEEIAQLNRDVANTVTGGDSYSHFVFSAATAADSSIPLVLIHEGKFPLYDVRVRIVDLDAWKKSGNTVSNLHQADAQADVGNIPPGTAAPVGTLPLNGRERNVNIFIGARNGFVTQEVRMRLVNGQWKVATRVTKGLQPEEVLFQKVDDGYPLSTDGTVNF